MINKIYESIGAAFCRALPFFHSFTGSDTTSQFVGKAKKSASNAWMAYPDATNAFMIQPFETINVDFERFEIIERFVCILYECTTNVQFVNDLRKIMFSKKEFSKLPPTQAALLQHTIHLPG